MLDAKRDPAGETGPTEFHCDSDAATVMGLPAAPWLLYNEYANVPAGPDGSGFNHFWRTA